MNNSIQNEAETQELRREIPFRSAPEDDTNEGTDVYQRSRLDAQHHCACTCLPRACAPGPCSCLVTQPKQHRGLLRP